MIHSWTRTSEKLLDARNPTQKRTRCVQNPNTSEPERIGTSIRVHTLISKTQEHTHTQTRTCSYKMKKIIHPTQTQS